MNKISEQFRPRMKAIAVPLALVFAPVLASCDTGPSDPLAAAQEALANGEPRSALDFVDQAIDSNPADPLARMVAGDAALALANPDRAISEYGRIAESDSQYSLARAKLAEAQLMGNYLDSAGKTIETLTMDNPTAFIAAIGYQFALGEPDAGYALLDEGLKKYENDPRLITIDAERLWTQGKADAAFARLEPALAIEPPVAQAHLFAGQLELTFRNATAAQDHFEKVLSVRPMHQTAMLAMAAIARDSGDTTAAGNWIDKANDAGPSHPIGLLFAAQMAYDADDLPRAFALLEKAPPAFSGQPEFVRLRGLIDARRDQHAMAALSLGNYVDQTGGDVLTRQLLARSLGEEGKFKEAWDAISPVIDHPQMDAAGLALALQIADRASSSDVPRIAALLKQREAAPVLNEEMVEAGKAIRAGDWAKADAIYTPLVAGKGKNDPALLNNAAAVKSKLNQHGEAVALARRALEEAPQSPEIMDTLGWALWNQGGNIAEARSMLTQARQGAPNNKEIADHWAIAHAE
ncbi:MAG: tetratricopeptide repeat protein [Pseudomonadota bacterium]